MQPHLNNDIRRKSSEKGKGLIGTSILHIALFALLIVVAFTPPKPPVQEEGILVNFGTDETGFGMIEPSPPPSKEEAAAPPPVAAQKATPKTAQKTQAEEPLLTQNKEEAPVVKKVDPEVEKKRLEKIEADKKLREQQEAERKQKELADIERKRIEAEQKRQSDIINRTRDALANSKAAGTNSKSEGEAGGKGNQGVPTGSIDTKNRGEGGSGTGNSGTGSGSGPGNQGISYELGGRGFRSLPRPDYTYQEEGRVVVEVSVDRSGKVIQAIPGTKGSNTLNENLLRVAKEAAMKATFDPKPSAPVIQKGTITYNFILR
ncbi:MAG: cell envelope integrity protein TolA [Bacteroidota bacterium]|nr:cell envelope integrity protein TolA [Bacteroidota bacterium]